MKSNTFDRSWTRSVVRGLALALTIFLVAVLPAEAGGTCTTAGIDEPFRLPDGSLHAAGTLTLCLERIHSPVAAMHEVQIDGMPVGLFMSRSGTSEGLPESGARAFMVFHRLSGGELSLFGVANAQRDRMQLHYLGYGAFRTPKKQPDLYALANDPSMVMVQAQAL